MEKKKAVKHQNKRIPNSLLRKKDLFHYLLDCPEGLKYTAVVTQ